MQTTQTVSQKRRSQRWFIYPKDVELILCRSRRTACRFLQEMRIAIDKPPKRMVSVQEFCDYTGMDEELVRQFMID